MTDVGRRTAATQGQKQIPLPRSGIGMTNLEAGENPRRELLAGISLGCETPRDDGRGEAHGSDPRAKADPSPAERDRDDKFGGGRKPPAGTARRDIPRLRDASG